MSTNNLFQLTFPDGWKETTVYTFEGPHDSGIQHNLVLVIDPFITKQTELLDYARTQLAGPEHALPGFELVSELEKSMPDGTAAYEIVYKYVPAENVVFFQKQVYLIKQGKACIFTGTFSKKTLQTIGRDVDAIIAGLKVFPSPEEQE